MMGPIFMTKCVHLDDISQNDWILIIFHILWKAVKNLSTIGDIDQKRIPGWHDDGSTLWHVKFPIMSNDFLTHDCIF